MTQPTLAQAGTPRASTDTPAGAAIALLACGVVAGPLYVVVSLTQALTREGFDLKRHAWSLLSNGDLGWIQISNFVLTGMLTIACAVGLWRTLHPRQGGTWGPLLLGVFGISLVAAGIFVADPALGFPPGAPAVAPTEIGSHSVIHFIAGSVGFSALIAACFVFARGFTALGRRGWATYSVATGVVFGAGFVAIAAASTVEGVALVFAAAVVLVWAWISAISIAAINGAYTR